ncbi:unnamed protein product [Echinostoma caproni]|uniref:Myosin motor domain-containing protein n=1 Tax=Echinostoma caproni TaxID=27848 RepID=A0A183AV44_9TREM|nr:unnamed protein product [Echinostoma caproni]
MKLDRPHTRPFYQIMNKHFYIPALNIGDGEESYPHPATADKLGQRNACQSKYYKNTELEVREPGHILARATSPVT